MLPRLDRITFPYQILSLAKPQQCINKIKHEIKKQPQKKKIRAITIKKTPNKDIVHVMGDFNAKIGPDAYANWAGTVGRYGTGKTNDRGLRLLEFASSHKLTIANTLYPHKLSRRTTWHALNGRIHNQIDFILPRGLSQVSTSPRPGPTLGLMWEATMTWFYSQ